ncbi:MAG: pyridoxal phosphate-dependent aminotransferase [Candidatus Aminicenantes bacterium]|nr:pyridoxal phosphate-dependent aminotransferase [Candidatus Aminicenantes bacterium]
MNKKFDQLADRTLHLEPEGAYAVLAKANELAASGKKIIHLEIGQPDFQTFANIAKAGTEAIMNGETRYTPSAGIPSLRKEIAEYTGERLGLNFIPDQVVVGPGAKPLLFFPMMAILEPGDEAIYPDPGFPSYKAIIETMGAKPVPIPLRESKNFSFDMDELEAKVNEKTRLLIINSPSNPTGGVTPEEDLKKVAELAEKYDFWVLSDEIYTRLVYSGEPVASICQIPGMEKRTIIMDGFSKTYAMTGWRLGYGIMPEALADKVGLLMTHSVGCTASFTQIAGIEALAGPQEQVEEVKNTFKKRRDIIVDGLNDIPGITCLRPDGAFYVFPNIKSFGQSSEKIADYLLSEAGVALLPGTSFGENGEGYLRLCYATSIKEIEEALSKIKDTIIKLN